MGLFDGNDDEVDQKRMSVDDLDDNTLGLIDRALAAQRPVAASFVRRLRERYPDRTPDQLDDLVAKRFRAMLTVTGAGVGGVAAMPGVGTVAAIAVSTGEGVVFAEACAFLVLAVAELHGIDMRDPEKRRIVVMGVLGGERGADIISHSLGQRGAQWSTIVMGGADNLLIRSVMQQVERSVRRKLAARLGTRWVGKLLPFGIGAVIGGISNYTLSRSVIDAAETVFASIEFTVESESWDRGQRDGDSAA